MRVVLKRSLRLSPEIRDMTFDEIADLVGKIQLAPSFMAPGTVIMCNEEAKYLGLPKNVTIGSVEFKGPIVIAGITDDGTDFCSIPEEIEENLRDYFPELWT